MMSTFALLVWIAAVTAEPLPEGWQARPLTEAELAPFSAEELMFMRNEVFARHGYVFKKPEIAEHFSKMPWYKPDPAFKAESLSKEEKANVALIKKVEDARRAEAEPEHTVFATTVKARLATLDADGTFRASVPLRAVLDCTATKEDPKEPCESFIDVYDDALGWRVARLARDIPTITHATPDTFSPYVTAFDLGDRFGALLRVTLVRFKRRQGGRSITDGDYVALDSFYAISSAGRLAKVVELTTSEYHSHSSGVHERDVELEPQESKQAEGLPPNLNCATTETDKTWDRDFHESRQSRVLPTKVLQWDREARRYR